jgi:hypothetical protein
VNPTLDFPRDLRIFSARNPAIPSSIATRTLVAAIFCAAGPFDLRSKAQQWIVALGAGIGGSLWWWIAYEQWYLSPLHGAIWGTAVALSAWSRTAAPVMRRELSVQGQHLGPAHERQPAA